ncbi:unspecified product [Leishmania tarentolae]|uniref:Unspecified product n=1 Tax=Leishmania tarentolae TaxID=5689 RepID=A0A640KX43_LEITA|nr:unspecified product [Leishmania tarentolae]
MLQLGGLVRRKPRAIQGYLQSVCRAAQRHTSSAPGKWKCACGLHNFDFHSECYSCRKKRTDLPASKSVPSLSLLGDMQMDDGDSTDVHTCSSTGSQGCSIEGSWMCPTCYTFNGSQRMACTHCRATRPFVQVRGEERGPLDTHKRDFGRVSEYSSPPSTVSSTVASGAAFSSTHSNGSVPRQPFMKGDWNCACGAHNFSRNTHCRKCHEPATSNTSTTAEERLTNAHPGDWTCPECTMYNFSWRKVCKRCNRAQPTTNTEASSSQPHSDVTTGMVAGWVCQACHSLNPADDTVMCVICGSPRRS